MLLEASCLCMATTLRVKSTRCQRVLVVTHRSPRKVRLQETLGRHRHRAEAAEASFGHLAALDEALHLRVLRACQTMQLVHQVLLRVIDLLAIECPLENPELVVAFLSSDGTIDGYVERPRSQLARVEGRVRQRVPLR